MIKLQGALIQKLKNRKGQVALFVALIFQILFIFFAMVINVGLLVHHKINLQNSVDMAAYYGAMKQAENMNAIAHINYQVRQSWKLLAWRYRAIGTAGDFDEHPVHKEGNRQLGIRPGSADTDDINMQKRDFYEAPSFCATYVPFKPMPDGENTCKSLSQYSGIRLFEKPAVIAGQSPFNAAISKATETLRYSAIQRCKYFGAYNYKLLAQYVVAYNIDQGDRMLLIAALSRSMSQSTEDFYDIDGDSVKTGITKTLQNNLTTANKDSLSLKVYNSLGAEGCNNPSTDEMPAKWLVPIRIAPAFNYIDTDCARSDANTIKPVGRELSSDSKDWPMEVVNNPNHELARDIRELAQFVGMRDKIDHPYNYSLGVEKNPWCMAYVGVSASTRPNIPFSPFGTVELKARAFFKPFGGRMGPWYESQWPSGSDKSSGGGKMDANVPPRIADTNSIGEPRDPTRAANYSRFVGDMYGMKSRNVLYQFGRGIYKLDPSWSLGRSNSEIDTSDKAPNFMHWNQLPFDFAKKGSGNGDMLAWSEETKKPSRFRNLELLAILPDQFDMAYYSIEPDFYHNYYTRIKSRFIPKVIPGFDKEVRPDIGYHKDYNQNGENLNEFSVKDQYKVLKNPEIRELSIDLDQKLTYLSKDWKNVLTGWADNGLLDYSLNTGKLGKCSIEPKYNGETPAPATSGNCIVGGSTGYSVKMISSDYLNTELQLGGDNSGKAKIKNLPPSDF
ncbi:Tad domain-containing protein [Bdellovibrio sp. SKB1291214]|uniref:TadE/TadG family type IV pilus assembly protein n=1 Tax=Bdellovibrio sp. SKB1291214 TaxID=1732569 RepID=UPI000B51C090|nr:Tad domain-containing protein [Bdellovibrio sp. SKB1291214]UYL10675.1 Tad domain-containing protein [Bdellovibrio sp. SKB1291214]